MLFNISGQIDPEISEVISVYFNFSVYSGQICQIWEIKEAGQIPKPKDSMEKKEKLQWTAFAILAKFMTPLLKKKNVPKL